MWNVLRMQLDKEKSDHCEHFYTIGGIFYPSFLPIYQTKQIYRKNKSDYFSIISSKAYPRPVYRIITYLIAKPN
jgi:hypothetical protein